MNEYRTVSGPRPNYTTHATRPLGVREHSKPICGAKNYSSLGHFNKYDAETALRIVECPRCLKIIREENPDA